MLRKLAAIITIPILSMTFVVATGTASDARDTGWDCPGCKIRR